MIEVSVLENKAVHSYSPMIMAEFTIICTINQDSLWYPIKAFNILYLHRFDTFHNFDLILEESIITQEHFTSPLNHHYKYSCTVLDAALGWYAQFLLKIDLGF